MPTPKRSIRISDKLWEAAEERAKECGMTRSELTRMALGLLVSLNLAVRQEGVPDQAEPAGNPGYDSEEL